MAECNRQDRAPGRDATDGHITQQANPGHGSPGGRYHVNHTYRFTLGLSSVDAAGVLFYPELLRHAHDAYEDFMARIDWALPDILARGELLIPVVHVDADYLRPLRHGTPVDVMVSVGGLGDTSFTIDCDFVADGDTPSARVRSVHVCIDAAKHRPVPVPEGLREQLEPYLNH